MVLRTSWPAGAHSATSTSWSKIGRTTAAIKCGPNYSRQLPRPQSRRTEMNKIALSPNSLIGVTALEYIDALVKAGYDGIGLRMYASPGVNYESVTQPVTGDPALMHDIKSALGNSGLILYDALSYYIRPNFDLDHMMPSLEFTAELGFPYVLAICDDPDWNPQVENFGRLCDAVGNLGMTVSMEVPVTQNEVNTLPKALKVIEESGRQNAVICLDPMHFW